MMTTVKASARTLLLVFMAFAATALPAKASDEDLVHMLRNPDDYLIARGPQLSPEQQRQAQAASEAKREKSAAASKGEKSAAVIPGNFTVIPNATFGFQNNFSYIRFPNLNSDITATTSVRMVGDATGTDYGTALVDSPPWSSPQYSIKDLYESIGGTSFNPADTSVTLYLQNNQLLTGVQHVYYNSISDFFENMTACTYVDGVSYIPLGVGVVNIHTSTLQSRFPSVVKVHNKNATTTLLRLRVYDGPTGTLRGIIGFNAAPNSTYSFSAPQIEAAIGYIPTAADFHLNVFLENMPGTPADSISPPNAIITHTVTNVRVSGSVLNLTSICNIND